MSFLPWINACADGFIPFDDAKAVIDEWPIAVGASCEQGLTGAPLRSERDRGFLMDCGERVG